MQKKAGLWKTLLRGEMPLGWVGRRTVSIDPDLLSFISLATYVHQFTACVVLLARKLLSMDEENVHRETWV